jgi:hypothetical protein
MLHGDGYSDAYVHAPELQTEGHNLTFVHPFDDPDVAIAGQGGAMEILRQHQGPIDALCLWPLAAAVAISWRGDGETIRPVQIDQDHPADSSTSRPVFLVS